VIGSQWHLIGTYNFSAGTSGYVVLSNAADGKVVADAVRFVLAAADDVVDIIVDNNEVTYVGGWTCKSGVPTCVDNDNDGYGVCPDCGTAEGCTYDGDDCNDEYDSIYPGAPEIMCDGVDQDCSGSDDCSIPTTLTLLVPNGGDILPSGGQYAICWQAPLNAVKFDLYYSLNNGRIWNFIKSVTGLNCTHWEIPVLKVNKKKCRVKVIGYNASGIKVGEDTSDKPFTIDVVKVTSPDGGESLKQGTTHTITWRTNATISPVAKSILKYTTDGGATWKTITIRNSNTGNYPWTVPYVSSTRCKVKVIMKDANGIKVGSDVSDKVFTIQP
jgi:hypothetical protein